MRSRKNYSIETMPVSEFAAILQSGDFSPIGQKAWAKVFDEYIAEFGLNEPYRKYLELNTEAIKLFNEAYNGNQRFKATFAEVKLKEAEAIIKSQEGGSFALTVAAVSKFMGFQVNPLKTSVKEFYSYVKLMQNGAV